MTSIARSPELADLGEILLRADEPDSEAQRIDRHDAHRFLKATGSLRDSSASYVETRIRRDTRQPAAELDPPWGRWRIRLRPRSAFADRRFNGRLRRSHGARRRRSNGRRHNRPTVRHERLLTCRRAANTVRPMDGENLGQIALRRPLWVQDFAARLATSARQPVRRRWSQSQRCNRPAARARCRRRFRRRAGRRRRCRVGLERVADGKLTPVRAYPAG